MKKRIFSMILACAAALSCSVTALAARFRDVPAGHWAAGYIETAAESGWVEGCGGDLYRPEKEVTYGEFAAMTLRLLFPEELPERGSGRVWHEPYMETCAKKGIFDGTEYDLGAGGDTNMTRTALAVTIRNALRAAGAKLPGARELMKVNVPDLGLYCGDEGAAIRAVYALGVMNGCDGQGTFRGAENMTRAQAAAVLTRMSRVELEGEAPAPAPDTDERQRAAYEAIIAMKARYPEGTRWTNENSYAWRGGVFDVGYGCAGFAFLLSDAAFGTAKARTVRPVSLADVRVGDILRINNNTHSVIVLEMRERSVVVAEGNYNSSVHWGRELPASTVENADYLLTRYEGE